MNPNLLEALSVLVTLVLIALGGLTVLHVSVYTADVRLWGKEGVRRRGITIWNAPWV